MLPAAIASVTDVCAPRPASQHCPALSCATETMSAMVTQQLHSWPISRVLARSAAGDSQLVVAKQPEQFGAAIQAARGTRWLGVVLCTRGRGRRLGPKSALPAPCMRLQPYVPVPTGPVLISPIPGLPPPARRPLTAVAGAYASIVIRSWCTFLNNHVHSTHTTSQIEKL